MRELLCSEVANFDGLPNMPEDPDLAVHVGTQIATKLLEPLKSAFGHVTVRNTYRSPTVNRFCNEQHHELTANGITYGAYYCSDNIYSASRYIWDLRDDKGHCGGAMSPVIPWFLSQYEETKDPKLLAWWMRGNLPDYAEVIFFSWLAAFNIRWYEGELTKALYCDDGFSPEQILISDPSKADFDGGHSRLYPGFPSP